MKIYISLFVLAAVIWNCGKSDKKTTSPDPVKDNGVKTNRTAEESILGNAILQYDVKKELAVPNLDLAVTRMRVYKSTDPSKGASVLADMYSVELWYKLKSDGIVRYWVSNPLMSAPDGVLYEPYAPPQAILEYVQNESKSYSAIKVDTENAFLRKYPAYFDLVESQGSPVATPTPNVTTTSKRFSASDETALGKTGFTSLKNYQVPYSMILLENHREVEETATPKTGILSCVVNRLEAGQHKGIQFVNQSAELGFYVDKQGNNATNEGQRTDDVMVVPWNRSYAIVGINIKKKSINFLRSSSAPFYTHRSFKANYNDVNAKVTGFETLIRKCNEATNEANAAVGTLGNFRILAAQPSGGLGVFGFSVSAISGVATHCPAFATATDADKFKSFATYPCATTWTNLFGDGMVTAAVPAPNIWDGTKYAHDAGGEEKNITLDATHIEQSNIESVTF